MFNLKKGIVRFLPALKGQANRVSSDVIMNNLINYFGYKKSDFYDDGEDIICINYEDCELPTWDVYNDKTNNYEGE